MPLPEHIVEVETQQLIRYARRRLEEAYAYHSIRHYIQDISAVPHWAWGTLEWSDEWRRGWENAWADRAREALEIQDAVGEAGTALLQVAADFAQTDFEIALTFLAPDHTGQSAPLLGDGHLAPYMDYYTGGAGEVAVSAGSNLPPPSFRGPPTRWTPPDRPPPAGVPYHTDDPALRQLAQEQRPGGVTEVELPPRRVPVGGPGGGWVEEVEQGPGYAFDGFEQDGLEEFVQQYGATLIHIEQTATGLSPDSPRPWTDVIEPAWLSCPSVIDHRADLLEAVAGAYGDLGGDLKAETESLQVYWEGRAASAYFGYSERLISFLLGPPDDGLVGVAEAVFRHGKEAARLLRQLRIIYADVGYEHIQNLIERHQEYLAASTNLLGEIAFCRSPGSAASALLGAIRDFNGALATTASHQVSIARSLLQAESAATEAPIYPGYPRTIAGDALNPPTSWQDGTKWTPAG